MVGATGANTFASNVGAAGGIYFGGPSDGTVVQAPSGREDDAFCDAERHECHRRGRRAPSRNPDRCADGQRQGGGDDHAAAAYYANGTVGVSCGAGISATTGRAVNGIITAC